MPLSSKGGGIPADLTGITPGEILVWDASGKFIPSAAPPPGPHTHDAADIISGVFVNARLYNLTTVSTTDATTTVIGTVATTGDSALDVDINVQAHRTGGTAGTAGDGGVFQKRLRVKREAGVVTLGQLQSTYTSRDQSGWIVDAVVMGTSVQIRVTGALNNNIDWQAALRIFEV